jgi:hypothetical protein
MVPALLGLCYWPYLTRQGVIAGLLIGLLVVTLTEAVGLRWLGISAWGRWPLTVHAAVWGLLANVVVAVLLSAFTYDDKARKAECHRWLAAQTLLAPRRRRWVWPIALLTALWLLFAAGPGAVIGNSLFGDPNVPDSWRFGIPSIWAWQLGGWALGVVLLALLAYGLRLSTADLPIRSEK